MKVGQQGSTCIAGGLAGGGDGDAGVIEEKARKEEDCGPRPRMVGPAKEWELSVFVLRYFGPKLRPMRPSRERCVVCPTRPSPDRWIRLI
jgi:hypothetical protein